MIEVTEIIDRVNELGNEINEKGFGVYDLNHLEEFVKEQMVSALTRYTEHINDYGHEHEDLGDSLERFIKIHKLQ